MKLAEMKEKKYITINGEEITYHRIDHDINGNPRYVVHFLALGVEPNDYGKIAGLTKYRAKWFAGGYVIESCYNIKEDLTKYYLPLVKKYYNK